MVTEEKRDGPITKRWGLALPALLAVVFAAGVAHAADELDSGDTAWILVSTALVLFMNIPGLALFYGGLVRSKNVLSVLMQCLALTGIITVLWLAFGYSLAFDEGNVIIGGLSKTFLRGITGDTLFGSIPEVLFFSFQMTFAIITPALIVGALVERIRFSAMMLFCVIWVVVVYLPVCHMVWGPGGMLGGNQGDLAIGSQFALQLAAAVGVAVYTAIASWVILKGVAMLIDLRVTDQEENLGLDVSDHNEAGYRF